MRVFATSPPDKAYSSTVGTTSLYRYRLYRTSKHVLRLFPPSGNAPERRTLSGLGRHAAGRWELGPWAFEVSPVAVRGTGSSSNRFAAEPLIRDVGAAQRRMKFHSLIDRPETMEMRGHRRCQVERDQPRLQIQ